MAAVRRLNNPQFAAFFLVALLLPSCNEVGSQETVPASDISNHSGTLPGGDSDDNGGGTDGGSIDNPNGGSGDDGGFISVFKPALVIRGMGCIMCHGRVESNIVTDFGLGSPYYFGANTPGLSPLNGNVYGDHAQNWATAKVWGKLIVPSAALSYGSVNTTIARYLRSKLAAPDAQTLPPVVEEKGIMYIGAPTVARILEVGGAMPSSHPQWKHISYPSGVDVTGIRLAPGNQYVENTPGAEMVCAGDLIVDSVLFLNNLRLRTDNRGCRIYATKSVFIQGPITYLGTAPTRNLQITSARAIIMGLGPGAIGGGASNSLSNRLRDFWTRGSYFTRDASGSTQEKLDRIVLDGSYIPDLLDASAQVPYGRNVAFERIFLNAPNYQSRYLGQFKGVIVAEFALGSLGNFSFHFDPVFESVGILPLIRPADYLRVE